MLTSTRKRAILERLRSGGEVTVQHLAAELAVSPSTIRRDLDTLAEQGLARRVRGGAQSFADPEEEPFPTIDVRSVAGKEAVAAAGATLVRDGDVVLIDIGTTTSRLARHLRHRRITAITASLAVVDVLRDADVVDLIVLGGAYRRSYLSMVGMLTEHALREVHADVCFISTSGVTPAGQVMDTTGMEVPVKRAMLAAAERRVLLADRDKFPGNGLLRVGGPGDFTTLVTNDGADPATLSCFTEAGTEVVIA